MYIELWAFKAKCTQHGFVGNRTPRIQGRIFLNQTWRATTSIVIRNQKNIKQKFVGLPRVPDRRPRP